MLKLGSHQKSKAQVQTQLLLFSTISLLFSLFIGAFITVHPLYLTQFLGKAELVGLVAALASLAGLLSSLPFGVLSDKIGRKRLLSVSFFLISIVLFAFFMNTSLYALLGLQIAFGISVAPIWVNSEAFIKDISPIGRRGEFRSVYGTFANAGMFIGPLIGGLLAERFEIRTPYLFSAFLLLGLLFLVFKLTDTNSDGIRNTKRSGFGTDDLFALLKEFRQQPELKLLGLCTVSLFFWYSAKWVFGPLFLRSLGYSPFIIGLWLGISAVPFLLFQIPFGKLGDRKGKTEMICLGFLISTLFVIPLGFLKSLSSLLVMIFIISLGTTFTEPLIEARVTDIVPREKYGAYSGIFEFAKTSGFLIGPVSSSIFVYLFGISFSFIPTAIIFILTFALFWYNQHCICRLSS
jgi:MFS family permease